MKNFNRVLFFSLTGIIVLSFCLNSLADRARAQVSDSDLPIISSRSVWDNTPELHALMSWPPEQQNENMVSDWQPVERIIIHDTATANNDPLSSISRLQSIYRFHALTQGWGDIGYNYFIDSQGNIYEGRVGGNGSRGAHAFNSKTNENFNYGSVGISLIGSFGSVEPNALMYEALGKLIGWLAVTNNLAPTETQKTFSIWNSVTKSFSSFWRGAVVAGHKNVDAVKSDPATLDFNKVRNLAEQYRQKYQGLVYQQPGSSKIYVLSGGARKIYDTISDFVASGGSYQKIASLLSSQLDLFSESRFLKFPDGSLLAQESQPTIWLIENGKKRSLNITAKQFEKLGFDWTAVKKVTSGDLSLYQQSSDVIFGPEKSLFKDPLGKVFSIENGRKHWVSSGGVFGALGYQWKNVKDKSADYLATILDGAMEGYANGTLLKGSGPAIYLVENSQRRPFISEQAFSQLGYQSKKILKVADDELAFYPEAAFVGYKTGTILRAAGEPSVYLVSGTQRESFLSAEQFLNLSYAWKNVLVVSSEEVTRYSFAGNVKYPDGTLVQEKGGINVYRVESGLAKLIPDIATFNKLKLSWGKVLKISTSDFSLLFGSALAVSQPSPAPPANTTPASSTPSTPAIGEPNIRVAIWSVPSSQSQIIFSASGPYDVYDKNGNLLASKQSGEQFSVSAVEPVNIFAKLVPKTGTILEVASLTDLAWNKVTNYNKFRGNLELVYSAKSSKLWIVNELTLEEYLKGVAETNQGLATEYLKTMAVAARTYAYFYQKQGGKYGSDEVYHITNTTSDQLYKGYAREAYASDIVTAAQATLGEMVYYNNGPIVTAYSSGAAEFMTNGSRAACSVWGGKYCQPGFEYLSGGVKDPQGTNYGYEACGAGNHCVGLSGAGTRQMALLGKTYKEILTHYYKETEVKKIY